MTHGTTGPRIRLSPEQRRTQLLDLGLSLLSTRTLDALTIDLLAVEAGISRGLLYHYFGSKLGFQEAVVRRAVDDLVAQTAPPAGGEPLERLLASMAAYVGYVSDNYEGYASIVQAARSGNETLRRLHEEARQVLTDRIFTEDALGEMIADTPAVRLAVRGWSAMTEELVLAWAADPGEVTHDQLLTLVTDSLPALVGLLDRGVPPGDGH